jgi:3-hydroxy-9,10-secoandrosta-1,3,5(10)-triene-9,17-dione monooxygenase reductase component
MDMNVEAKYNLTDQHWLRKVLGHHATGVALVTAMRTDGTPVGMIVGTFTSVSLAPPLVAFLPSHTSTSWPEIRASGNFTVNILSEQQGWICREFSRRDVRNKFGDIEWTLSRGGSPLLEGCVAWVECTLDAVHAAGDHDIAVGRVLGLGIGGGGPSPANSTSGRGPLLFHRGGYGRFLPTPEPTLTMN